jgi:protein-tyrosine phosphatase
LKVLEDPKNWPVFVHCAEGKDRTGYSVATYRIVVEDWSSDDAIHEMFEFHYNPIWFENPRFLQRLDARQVLARVKMAP